MACSGRVALTLLLLMLTLLTQVVQPKPRRHQQQRHFHGKCLLEQVRGEVKHTWHLCQDQPEAHRVLHGIPVTSLCDDDFNALNDFPEGESQEKMDKCCRSPDRAKCSDNEWRTVLLARYIHVLCDHMTC